MNSIDVTDIARVAAASAYLQDLKRLEFTIRRTELLSHVDHVGFPIAEEQMGRVHAHRNIAAVKNTQVVQDWPVTENPCGTRSEEITRGYVKPRPSVPAVEYLTLPKPANLAAAIRRIARTEPCLNGWIIGTQKNIVEIHVKPSYGLACDGWDRAFAPLSHPTTLPNSTRICKELSPSQVLP